MSESLTVLHNIADRFRDAWKNGKNPRLELWLDIHSDVDQVELFRRFLSVELKELCGRGVQPNRQEYLKRFPQHDDVIGQVFRDTLRWADGSTQSYVHAAEASKSSQTCGLDDHNLGRYTLERPLGSGAFGVVWLARDKQLNRKVAIKLASADKFPSRQQLDMMAEEARLAGQLDGNSGVVAIHEVIPLCNGPDSRPDDMGAPACAIVMEYVDGGTLTELLRRRQLTPHESTELLTQLAEAMIEPHRHGVVHRDLKPGNILLKGRGQPVIADFGLATREENLALDGNDFCGTPAYMSPEQVRRERLDGRSDLWSLGVIFYQMLTGRRPFWGSEKEIIENIKAHQPKPPRQLNDAIPAELQRICLKCLAKSPQDRYLSAADLVKDLRDWQKPKHTRTNNLNFVALGLILLLAATIASARWFLGDREREQSPQSTRFSPTDANTPIRLTRESHDRYIINAGNLHGLTRGSVLAVYPPAVEANQRGVLGHVLVDLVKPLACEVSPCEHDGISLNRILPTGAICRLVFRNYGDLRIRVAVDREDVTGSPIPQDQWQRLTEILRGLASKKGSLVHSADAITNADWLLRVDADQVVLVPADDVQLAEMNSSLDSSTPHFGPVPVNEGLAESLRDRLQRMARVRNLLRMSTTEGDSGRDDVRVRLVRYDSATRDKFEEVHGGRDRVLEEGDIVQFLVHNNDRQPVDVTMLFIDSQYGITPYFPRRGLVTDNRLSSGETLESPRFEVTAAQGLEHMVVIAVRSSGQTEPADFGCLAQPTVERARGSPRAQSALDSPLGQLLQIGMFANEDIRGLRTVDVSQYVVIRMTWRVIKTLESQDQ